MACPEAPSFPAGEITQRDVANHLLGMSVAHAICLSNSQQLQAWVREQEALVVTEE